MSDAKFRLARSASLEAISAATHIVGRPIIRPDSSDFHFPDDTLLLALSFQNLTVKSVRIVQSAAGEDQVLSVNSEAIVYVTAGLRLVDIARIYVTCDTEQAAAGSVTLDLAYLSRRFSSPALRVDWPAGKGERQILELQSDRRDRRKELIAHLNANREYYGSVIHQSLDSGTIVAMLAEYSWNGRPLIDQVEPQPLTMAGNYLVFRAPAEPADPSGVAEEGKSRTWGDLLKDRAITVGKQSADERLIPLPTAGVFAEAVLGRSNSAEKLDITRFWNWQESPIPLTPTEIAPVGTGSRATPEDLRPGQLGQPVLNIVNPQPLPNPTGVGAVLGTLATPNMFRDMSGLAGTQNLVQSGMTETLQAATDAGQLASANLRTEAQKSVAMAQVAADIVKSMMGGGGSGSGASQGISGAGAMINHGKSMDKAAATANGNGVSSPGAFSGTTTGSGSNESRNHSSPVSNHQEAFDRALHGGVGASGVEAMRSAMAAAYPDAFAAGSEPSATEEDGLSLQHVNATSPAPNHLKVGEIGELLIANILEQQGHVVFVDPTKSVSANGIDLFTLSPQGEVWFVDNKAWMKGISGAEALSEQQAIPNYAAVVKFLEERWPNRAQAAAALNALKNGKFRQVVSNAFAGETARFTKALFSKRLWVFDIRMQKVFTDHATWEAAFRGLTLRRGLRLTGVRGAAMVEYNLMVLAVIGGAAMLYRTAGPETKALAVSVAADLTFGVMTEVLSTKIFQIGTGPAAIVQFLVGLEADTPQVVEAQKREELLWSLLPDWDKLSAADQNASRQALKDLLNQPLVVPTATAAPPAWHPAPAGRYTPPSQRPPRTI